VLVLFKAYVMAGVVAGIGLTVWLLRTFSAAARRRIDNAMGIFVHWVGQAVAVILLAPVFFLIMTVVRLINRLGGTDPLHLRSGEAPTFWLAADLESRRSRYVKSMFCTERLTGGRVAFLPVLALGVLLLVGAEIGLRLYGFGTPVLYVQDTDVGYYPKPNQRVRHPGRVIAVNNHSMRSPDIAAKAPGHIRILMLGDSTLAGTWVSNHELYSSLLEKKLNAAAGAPVFEVLNMGVNAWGPFHERAFVKKFGAFEADVAIICGPIFNVYRPGYGLDRLPLSPAAHPPRFAIEQILYEMCWRFREKSLGPPPWAVAGEPAEEQARLGIAAYVDMARLLQQQGAEVLVEMLPAREEALEGRHDPVKERLLAELTRQLGAIGVSMNCAGHIFKDVPSPAKIYHDTVHFDRPGHRLYAEYLAERLRKTSSRVSKAIKTP
jgi:hypothetical protein